MVDFRRGLPGLCPGHSCCSADCSVVPGFAAIGHLREGRELNEWLERYSKSRHLIYVDYYRAVTDGALGIRSDLSADGVHPSQAGYRVMEPLTNAAVRSALLRRTHPR